MPENKEPTKDEMIEEMVGILCGCTELLEKTMSILDNELLKQARVWELVEIKEDEEVPVGFGITDGETIDMYTANKHFRIKKKVEE